MIQVLPRVQQNISFATTTDYWSVNDGGVGTKLSSTFGPHIARIPLPWATTIRNLILISHDATSRGDIAVALMKNNVASGMGATLPGASDGPVSDTVNAISFAALDDFSYRAIGTSRTFPGNTIAWSVDADQAGNVFGVSASWGGYAANQGGQAGALGNGFWQSYDHAAGYARSTSYSICATPGNLTKLVAKTYEALPVPVGSSWVAYIILNGVRQDGSGGSVDTRCTITAGNYTGSATFVLPLVKGDHVEVAFYRTGATSGSEPNVAVGIGFIPTTDGMFMLTGGSNDVIGDPTGYRWIQSAQNLTDETLAMAPIGPSGLITRGIYIERLAPGGGNKFVHTVRRNGANTPITVTLEDSETSGLIDNLYQPYTNGGTIDISSTAIGGNQGTSRMYWGLEVSVLDAGPPAVGLGVIGPHQRIVFPRTQPEDVS